MERERVQRLSDLNLSIVIAIKDEVDNIVPVAAEIDRALAKTQYAWECIWIDDGSTDGSARVLTGLCDRSPNHRCVELDENYGQSAALFAGFCRSRGRVIAMLDGDGQSPPEEIPRLVDTLLANNLDMVTGYRQRRYSLVRELLSRIANGFRNHVTGDHIRDVGCSLRAFRAECVDGMFVFKGMHRFLPTLVRLNGFDRITEIPVDHRPRQSGRSKYGIRNRLWVGILDTLAVRWMDGRRVSPLVRSDSATTSQPSAESTSYPTHGRPAGPTVQGPIGSTRRASADSREHANLDAKEIHQ